MKLIREAISQDGFIIPVFTLYLSQFDTSREKKELEALYYSLVNRVKKLDMCLLSNGICGMILTQRYDLTVERMITSRANIQ